MIPSPSEPWRDPLTAVPPQAFWALSDPARRRLIECLVGHEAGSGELARRLSMPRANVRHHLGVLAAGGLVSLRGGKARANREAMVLLRRYFDVALSTAAFAQPRAQGRRQEGL